MTNNHSIDEMSESNNLADNHVEREYDLIDWNNKGDEDDDWVELMDVDDDWGDNDEGDPLDRYDDFDDDGAGWDVYQGASANPYYNDQLDLDQQSDEFWECL